MKKRVFVTGASGFIGGHLLASLRKDGHQVVALERSTPSRIPAVELGLETLSVSSEDADGFSAALRNQEFDAICHLAAFIPPNLEEPEFARRCFESNALLTLHLLRAAVSCGIDSFVHCSSGNIYSQDATEPATEDDAIFPSRYAPYYLSSKVQAETFVEYFRVRHHLRVLTLRLSAVFGPGMPEKSVLNQFVTRAIGGLPIVVTNERYKADFVYVDDVVNLISRAVGTEHAGVFNVGSGKTISMLSLGEQIAAVFASASEIQVEPASRDAFGGFRALDIAKARSELGFVPASLHDALVAMSPQFVGFRPPL